MKIAQQVRALLKDGKPRTAKEIYTALGTDPTKTAESASNQALRGYLVKDGSVYPARYTIGQPPPEKLSPEELLKRSRDRRAAARIKAGGRSLAQIRAERAEATRIRVLTAKVAKSNRKATKTVVAPKKPMSIRIEPRRLSVIEAKPEPVKLPCTDTWIRQNPDKVQRLPPGQWSQPLRFEY